MSSFFDRFVTQHIKIGHLSIIYPSGRRASFGDGTGDPVTLHIKDIRTLWSLMLNPELAFGEAFMEGKLVVEEGDIYAFLEVVFKNSSVYSLTGPARFRRWLTGLRRRFHQHNPVGRAKDNVAHHYDLDGSLYRLFLDSDSQYSCAYFENAGCSLEEAQLAKKRHLTAKLLIEPGQKVLDIGSGWGGLGLYMAEMTEADVIGVTLSQEQFAISNERAHGRNLAGNAQFHLKDYRHLEEQFDRIVSVGMFEHVGVGHYDEFFTKVRSLLKPDGVMVLHSIGVSDGPSHTNPWIHKYIFPGGYIPALSEVLPAIERQGLIVCDIEILRLHYAETLKAWRDRFMARRGEAVRLYDERFARMWEFYLASSETAFRHQGMMVFQIQLAREQAAVPQQRDYIQEAENRLREMEASLITLSSRAAE
ncbi:cyclopropane-fatty-acyl-phospholipid synthase [Brucella sp. NBRC 13694]|jgi:cyclopropane-fatty-acyl-phospholipid synthase|uniref:SAM-dependent methyltransferase n=1 Tax=Brucella/Ochrobactrum group TaxID=2826938 RepID=UPI000F68675D|nr:MULTISPECIES: cyclopropane-fatty-acyl-phospholipid synthase family protein [Brucella/Ochrobactrum group]MCQ9147662.1 cyclopropane-fatty-acyl-phospholipid synthase family protein [Ochrobactrum sp. BTU2]MCR5943631.1 class I SAM-dependent methyltransferase [Ochrobactrum sp. XJ1]RRY15727.1 class I SAM-dependent methyltransferase [Brucella anthropi]